MICNTRMKKALQTNKNIKYTVSREIYYVHTNLSNFLQQNTNLGNDGNLIKVEKKTLNTFIMKLTFYYLILTLFSLCILLVCHISKCSNDNLITENYHILNQIDSKEKKKKNAYINLLFVFFSARPEIQIQSAPNNSNET